MQRYNKAYVALLTGWLAANFTPDLITTFNGWLGWSVPAPVVAAFAALVVAAAVWATPNKR